MCLVRKMWGMVLKSPLATSKWKTWLFMRSPQLLQVHLSFFEHPCFWQSPAFECWHNDSWKHLQIVWLVQLSHKFHNWRQCKVKLKGIMCSSTLTNNSCWVFEGVQRNFLIPWNDDDSDMIWATDPQWWVLQLAHTDLSWIPFSAKSSLLIHTCNDQCAARDTGS